MIGHPRSQDEVVHAHTDLEMGESSRDGGPALEEFAGGQVIDHFRVLRVLGQGGMGRVLLARDTRLGRLAALKIIRPDRVDPEPVLALLDEARLTARLSHPHIVAIYQIGRSGNSPYIALEYVDGVSLRRRMREGRLGEREAVRVAVAIASALAAAHQAGITHRDLKPDNVMVPADGRVRVLDFGVAAVMETQTGGPRSGQAGIIVGTPAYMAPEQSAGEAPTPAVDIWALGITLYEMLATHQPFDERGAGGRALADRLADSALLPPPLAVESVELQEIVIAMLDRQPSRRPTAAQLVPRLEALLRGAEVSERGVAGTLLSETTGPVCGDDPSRTYLPDESSNCCPNVSNTVSKIHKLKAIAAWKRCETCEGEIQSVPISELPPDLKLFDRVLMKKRVTGPCRALYVLEALRRPLNRGEVRYQQLVG